MAKENIAFLVNLRKNTIPESDMYGRYYPEAETKETLTTKGFAKHVSEHGGTLVNYEFMQLVLANTEAHSSTTSSCSWCSPPS